jgi:uracil-DNA glycosylase family 4
VTNVRELLARYLAQRDEVGEGPMIMEPDPRAGLARQIESRAAEQKGRSRVATPAGGVSVTGPPAAAGAAPGRRPSRRTAEKRERESWREGAPAIPPAGIVIAPPTRDLFAGDELTRCDIAELAARVHSCSRCPLHASRTNAVPGEGPGDARLVVVGEGPGAREDETGRPFVGRAGELLTDILRAIDLPRERVFICNVVKCRPPGNRTPVQEEIDQCVPYLYRQLEIISPAVILAMGGTAAQTLLNTRQSLASLRNRLHSFRGMPLIVTYHPAALLRNPNWKKPTWDDVRIARQLVDR